MLCQDTKIEMVEKTTINSLWQLTKISNKTTFQIYPPSSNLKTLISWIFLPNTIKMLDSKGINITVDHCRGNNQCWSGIKLYHKRPPFVADFQNKTLQPFLKDKKVENSSKTQPKTFWNTFCDLREQWRKFGRSFLWCLKTKLTCNTEETRLKVTQWANKFWSLYPKWLNFKVTWYELAWNMATLPSCYGVNKESQSRWHP